MLTCLNISHKEKPETVREYTEAVLQRKVGVRHQKTQVAGKESVEQGRIKSRLKRQVRRFVHESVRRGDGYSGRSGGRTPPKRSEGKEGK